MLLAIGLAAVEAQEKRDAGIDELVGTWVMKDGPGGCTVEFTRDGRITWHSVGPLDIRASGTYKVDGTKDPKQIDIRWGTMPEPAGLGIYKIEGDRLTLLADKERPKGFDAEPHTNLVLKRQAR